VHVLVFCFFVFYVLFHAYLGTLGPTPGAHYKAMFTGYEEIEGEHGAIEVREDSPGGAGSALL
jgi:thiosulfate reductase cytochrome b subunit